MSPGSVRAERFRRSWVVGAAVGVVVWRVMAFVWPSSLVSVPGDLRLPLALLGAAGVLPGPADAWNLAFGLVPVSLAIPLLTVPRTLREGTA